MIFLEVDGKVFEGFTEIQVKTSMDSLSGSFSFRATSNKNFVVPIKVGQSCKVFVEGEQVITGFVEKVSISYNQRSHSLLVEGRDKTGDIIDSTLIDDKVEISSELSLKSIIEQTLFKNNFTGIKVINNVPTLQSFRELDVQSGATGQTIFNFLQLLARKRQVFLITDGLGNIVISRSSTERIKDQLLMEIGNEANNILSGSINFDHTERFNRYIVESQDNPSSSGAILGSTENIVGVKGENIDDDIKRIRTLGFLAEESYTKDDCEKRAKWEHNIRRVRSRSYTAIVQGHKQRLDNEIWKSNRLVPVRDEFSNLNTTMLINNVSYNVSLDEGSTTAITCVDQDAYQVQGEEPVNQKQTNKQGLDLVI